MGTLEVIVLGSNGNLPILLRAQMVGTTTYLSYPILSYPIPSRRGRPPGHGRSLRRRVTGTRLLYSRVAVHASTLG